MPTAFETWVHDGLPEWFLGETPTWVRDDFRAFLFVLEQGEVRE